MFLAVPITILVSILALYLIIIAIGGTVVIGSLLGADKVIAVIAVLGILMLIDFYSSEIGKTIKFIALTIGAIICFLGMVFSFTLTESKAINILIAVTCFVLLCFIADIYIILTALAIIIILCFFLFKSR